MSYILNSMKLIKQLLIGYKPIFLFSSTYSTSENLFKINIDRHNGVHFNIEDQHFNVYKNFTNILRENLTIWISSGYISAWIHIPIQHSYLISEAEKFGFLFHHAENKIAVICKWLKENQKSRLPLYATHQLGVAGCVYDVGSNSILLVKDKNMKMSHSFWKFPGGLADLGEDIESAAKREVFEETSINANFDGILAFRQHHNFPGAFMRSDIFFFCLMHPTNVMFRNSDCQLHNIPPSNHKNICNQLSDENTFIFDSSTLKNHDNKLECDNNIKYNSVDITCDQNDTIKLQGPSSLNTHLLNNKLTKVCNNNKISSSAPDILYTINDQAKYSLPQPIPCPHEIEACDWFDMNYLLANENLITPLTVKILRLIVNGDIKLMMPRKFKTILGTDSLLYSVLSE